MSTVKWVYIIMDLVSAHIEKPQAFWRKTLWSDETKMELFVHNLRTLYDLSNMVVDFLNGLLKAPTSTELKNSVDCA